MLRVVIAGCLNFRCFQFLFAVSVSTFWVLDFFRRFVGFFRRFVGYFRRFKTGKRMQHEKNAKSVRRQKNMPPAIIPEKAIILHTLEDAGMVYPLITQLFTMFHSYRLPTGAGFFPSTVFLLHYNSVEWWLL